MVRICEIYAILHCFSYFIYYFEKSFAKVGFLPHFYYLNHTISCLFGQIPRISACLGDITVVLVPYGISPIGCHLLIVYPHPLSFLSPSPYLPYCS